MTRLGLAANWRQFTLLVVINAFVGAMVGLERAVLPLVAEREFGLASTTTALAFIAAFGLAKACTNLAAGALVDRRGRRVVLIAGWLVALPVPLLILAAPTWWWIVGANLLLGVNQGLAWSATVIMKIDLAGPRRRGLAMGLNEFAGYLAVAGAALASGVLASRMGLREGPAWAGLAIALVGLTLSVLFARETAGHARHEERLHASPPVGLPVGPPAEPLVRPRAGTLALFRHSLWADRQLFSVSQAGLVNNLNDGLAWGLFPLLFAGAALSITGVSALVAIYPATWGVAQLITGPLSDRWGRKPLIVAGMLLQGTALIGLALGHAREWVPSLVFLGLGTAMVYPTLLAAVGDVASPAARGAAVGVYRFWRDMGYVAGALVAGVLADILGVPAAIGGVGALTIVSGLVVAGRFHDDRRPRAAQDAGLPSLNAGGA